MGFIQALKQFLHRKPKDESLSIASNKDKALQQRFEALFKAPQALQQQSEALQSLQSASILEEKPSIELQKDSIQLGLAAGYATRALRDIESSISRIESQIVTKEWFLSQFKDNVSELIDLFKKHEENEQKRFEAIQNIVISLQRAAEKTSEPLRTELFQHIEAIEHHLPLTPKMNELLEITKQLKEVSYEELHQKLGISLSALRGLLTNMVKRTNKIERFEKDNKGWVRYLGD